MLCIKRAAEFVVDHQKQREGYLKSCFQNEQQSNISRVLRVRIADNVEHAFNPSLRALHGGVYGLTTGDYNVLRITLEILMDARELLYQLVSISFAANNISKQSSYLAMLI